MHTTRCMCRRGTPFLAVEAWMASRANTGRHPSTRTGCLASPFAVVVARARVSLLQSSSQQVLDLPSGVHTPAPATVEIDSSNPHECKRRVWKFAAAVRAYDHLQESPLSGRAPMQIFLRVPLRVLSSRGMATGRAAPEEPPFPWRCDMLAGKAAIVTGGSAGIGASITEALLRAGASVAVLARSRSKFDGLLPILEEKKLPVDKTHFIPIDLSSTDDIRRAAIEANDWAGGCADILVNNAGVATIAPILEATIEDWDWTMNVRSRRGNPIEIFRTGNNSCEGPFQRQNRNLHVRSLCVGRLVKVNVRAPFIMAQECAKRMIVRGKGGKIVNTSSTASRFALHDHAAYCTSKAAINGLTNVSRHNFLTSPHWLRLCSLHRACGVKVMSAEWSKHDINCNTIGPTIVLTDMGAKAWGEPEKGDPMVDRTPLGRFAEPWEMAHGVVYLVSPSSSQMCGQMLLLDGGITTTGTPCGV
ncbi:unnamed protein product [Ectocarpus sp. CCAP 1310/34]|nr:unnamed protein product [Ectocarpus sp. CCAP 1310/34]